jgi:hypothetical protein
MTTARRLLALLLAGAALFVARGARAQVRWDLGAQAGVMQRLRTGSDVAAPGPEPGPAFGVQGHLAVVPMVRVGLYASGDFSPTSDRGTRSFWEGGLHVKFTPPLLPAPWRTWVFAGFGYAYTYKTSYHHPETDPNGHPVDVAYDSTHGGMLDIPAGVGLGYKLQGLSVPCVLFAELGGRFGVGFFGPMYDSSNTPGGLAPNSALSYAEPFMGQDSFALSVSVGLSLDE